MTLPPEIRIGPFTLAIPRHPSANTVPPVISIFPDALIPVPPPVALAVTVAPSQIVKSAPYTIAVPVPEVVASTLPLSINKLPSGVAMEEVEPDVTVISVYEAAFISRLPFKTDKAL